MDKKVEIVKWIDAHSIDAWTDIDKLDLQLSIITSIGQVLTENDEVLVLGLNYNETDKEASCNMQDGMLVREHRKDPLFLLH